MADISSTVKKKWMRGMEAVGDAFDRLAASTRLRVAEMNLSNQRKEILDGFGLRAYQMWKDGAALPPELEELLQKVSELEKQLAEVRAERLRSGIPEDQTPAEGPAAAEEGGAEEPAPVGETVEPGDTADPEETEDPEDTGEKTLEEVILDEITGEKE